METLCFDVVEIVIGLNPITYAALCTIKCFHDMFVLENKLTNFWKKKFGYTCRVYAPQNVDDGRNVEWKHRNSILGPRYIPFRGHFTGEVLFGNCFTNHFIVGRAITRTWRPDIEHVPYRQIIHCSGASSESHQEYNVISELHRNTRLGLSVLVKGHVIIENIKISIECVQSELRNSVSSNNICFSRRLQNSPGEWVISLVCADDAETWMFVISETMAVVIKETWTDFCNSMKEKYPEIHPEIMKFYHDLLFLLAEQPRLTSCLTVYEDHFRRRVSIPKTDFWRDDFLYPFNLVL